MEIVKLVILISTLLYLIYFILRRFFLHKYQLRQHFDLFLAETLGLTDLHPVEMLQDQAQCILGDYVRNRYQRQPTRFGRLLLSIPLLRMIRTSLLLCSNPTNPSWLTLGQPGVALAYVSFLTWKSCKRNT